MDKRIHIPASADVSTLGKRIRYFRKGLDLKQRDLAKAASCSIAAVSAWERDQTSDLKLEHLFKIADKLRVSARYLAIADCSPNKEESIDIDEAALLELYRDFKNPGLQESWVASGQALLRGIRGDALPASRPAKSKTNVKQ